MSQDFHKGIGKVLIAQKNKIVEYPLEESKSWIPNNIWEITDLMDMIGRQVLEFQIRFLSRSAIYTQVGLEKKNLIKQQLNTAKRVNRLFLKSMDEK